MQKQQNSRIYSLENEIQDLLEEFGNYELDETVNNSLEDIKEKAKKLKDEIDIEATKRQTHVKEV